VNPECVGVDKEKPWPQRGPEINRHPLVSGAMTAGQKIAILID
jgi:hypothetical protein